MKRRALRILLAWFVLLPAGAVADGGFVPGTAFEKVRIPDQRALIHFAAGTETLVIDTSFKGNGTNFAWIIPVPSVPIVEPATTGLFPTLQFLFRAEIVHHVFGFYWVEALLGLVIAYIVWNHRQGESPLWTMIILGLVALTATMLLPAFSLASISGSSGQVMVIERKRVGVYETATLRSPDGQAVFDWLKQNGFPARTNFIPAIRSYAKDGWYFVASKIRLDAPMQDAAKAHPLALKFKTQRPVYPLRLTGIDNESCRIELYIFGPSRAELPNFSIERCAKPLYPDADDLDRARMEVLRIRHPLLRSLVDGSPAATKLVGTLNSKKMGEDAYITWTPLREKRATRYSRRAAAIVGANFAAPVLILGLLVFLARSEVWTIVNRTSAIILFAALVCWGTIYLCLPKTQVFVSRMPGIRMANLHHEVPNQLTLTVDREVFNKSEQAKLEWVRQRLAPTAEFRRALPSDLQTNLLTGELWREEDSPGNYTIRTLSTNDHASVDYVWYDLEGAENVVPLIP